MSALPDFDLYETLGVAKDATSAEIKASHRKLVLRCHPDKIKDESLRSEAQDQFQRVQQAYEVLSDDTSRTKYDNKVKLAELKREMMARGASYSRSTPREYRDGRIYEERVPADARSSNEAFFDEQERFTESPRPTSRKHDDYGSRTRSKPTEEKRRSRAPPASATRAAKEARETTRASRADRDKHRTKERRRQAYDKQTYPDSDSFDSDSDQSEVYYVAVKRPSESKRHRDSKSKPTEPNRRSGARRRDEDDDDYSDTRDRKHDEQYSVAQNYIRRSKETIAPETDRKHRSSHSPLRYDSPEPEARHSARSSRRSTRETTRPPTSHHSSFEHLDPSLHRVPEKAVPSMPTAQTYPGPRTPASPRPSHQTTRSATNVHSQPRPNRESVRRSETTPLMNIYSDSHSRTTKLRSQKPDSGYVSSSPTPEASAFAEASPKPRHKVREPVIVEPSSQPTTSRSSRMPSPSRPERRGPSRSSYESSRRLYGEVDPDPHLKEKLRHAREVPRGDLKPDVQYIRPTYPRHPQTYHEGYHHGEYRAMPRREPGTAYA
ncbi:hypothetical protein BJX70DRAFT_279901 [Aspergillus crustosus]